MPLKPNNRLCNARNRPRVRLTGILSWLWGGLLICIPLSTVTAVESPEAIRRISSEQFESMATAGLGDKRLIRVLENYYQSNLGGPENWAAIESIRFDGRLRLPGGTVRFSAYKKKPDYCKIMLHPSPRRQIIMAYDGTDAWQLDTGQPDAQPFAMPEKEALNFIRDATTGSHLLHPTFPGKTITLGSTMEVEGAMCRKVHVDLPSGQTISYVLNLSNHAERQQITTNAVNGQREVTTHYEYEEIGGIRFPTESILRIDGKEIHRVEMTEITLNPGLMPWMFARPREAPSPAEAPEPAQPGPSIETEAWNPSPFSTEGSGGSVFQLPPDFGAATESKL